MCAIAGWVGSARGAAADESARLARMCASMVHRGPDDEGTYLDEGVALGMRRLSIIDVAGGHQPMTTPDGNFTIVFNGEIYNHHELRNRLLAEGYVFKTRSDTEIVLRLFERDGFSCLNLLNGMFAIAIWDKRLRSLYLMRDRMGVKPLYYSWDGKQLVFASEIKAILTGLPQRPAINGQAVWDYFTFRYIPQPQTIWQGIYKLPPAHHLTMRAGARAPVIERWWDVPPAVPQVWHDADHVAEFDVLLSDATRLRMLADVPVGVLLSGGLDSSLLAARASGGPRLKTFSIAFEGASDIDERPYARQVARRIGSDHNEIAITHQHVRDFLPDFVHYADEPLADAVCIPMHFVCKLVREHVKVVLSGEGADETLGGYSFDHAAQRWDDAAALARAGVADVDPALLDLRRASLPPTMTAYLSDEQKAALFRHRDFTDSHAGDRLALARYGDATPLSQALYLYCQDWLVEDLLMKADKMSMATSVELRTPFLDFRLVEAAFRLPDHLRVGRNASGIYETKRILRILARRGELPDDIVERPKMGFPVPIYEWLRDPERLLPLVTDHLTGPGIRLHEWLEPQALADIVALGTATPGKRKNQHIVYNALVMEMWLRHWT